MSAELTTEQRLEALVNLQAEADARKEADAELTRLLGEVAKGTKSMSGLLDEMAKVSGAMNARIKKLEKRKSTEI
jgi:hypothetical protein